MLLRPLPFAQPNELVLVTDSDRQTRQSNGDATPANFLDWRVRQHSFTALSAFRQASFALSGGDRPESVAGAIVNANFFDVLDVKPALGRTFAAADEGPGAPRVAVLSDGLWRQRFGARPDAIGQTLRINDEPHTIVGVMPAGIDYPDRSRAWIPPHWRVPDDPLAAGADPAPQRNHGYFSVVARLKPAQTIDGAQADMDAVAATLERDFPASNQNAGVQLTPLRDRPRLRRQADRAAALRGGRAAAAHRDRQRVRAAAGARHGAASGDGGAHRARREPRTDSRRSSSPRASCSRCSAAWPACCSRCG